MTQPELLAAGRGDSDVQSHIINSMMNAERLVYGTAYDRVHENVMPAARARIGKTPT